MCWGNRRRKTCEGLFFFHSSAEPCKAFFGGLLNEGYVFSQVLLSVDFAFLAPLQLVQPELRDYGAVFLVQRLPDRRTGGLFGDGVFVARGIGGFGMRHRSDDQAKENG